MPALFRGSNAVVLAHPANPFNPSFFSQVWMITRLQVDPNDFQGTAVQMPIFFSATTRQFNLAAVSERIQINLPTARENDWEPEGDIIRRVMRESLAHTPEPYAAAGFNFNWSVSIPGRSNPDISRVLFFSAGRPIFRLFDIPDACFGVYASRNFFQCRLRVDAKPMLASDESRDSQLLFNYNFNFDCDGNNQREQIEDLLIRWEVAKIEATQIMDDTVRELEP